MKRRATLLQFAHSRCVYQIHLGFGEQSTRPIGEDALLKCQDCPGIENQVQRLKPGPFNGLFDNLTYEHPAFIPIIVTCGLLLFVWFALAWALWRRWQRAGGQTKGRGFAVGPAKREERDI